MMPSDTSPIIRPSMKMPAPPNMRRTDTGPNSLKSSPIASASTALLMRVRGGRTGGRRQLHRLAAAAGRGLVRVVEHEGRRELVDLEVHLGAEQEHDRLRVDQQLDALALHHLHE